MFCSKCGKEIDNNATFCQFCGNPINAAANSVPQYNAPQNNGIQNQPVSVGFSLNLAPNVANLVRKVLFGILGVLGILVLIGSIGTMATFNSLMNGKLSAARALYSFYGLARVPAILTFSFSVLGAIYTYITKQNSLISYISAGIGLLMFIFNFVLYGANGIGGVNVSCIFLLLGALAMIASAAAVILNKEDILNKFKK